MKLDVFGKEIEVVRSNSEWKVFYLGNEGKKRLATDISIPEEIQESGVVNYLEDIYHELSTAQKPKIIVLD
jgi:hypothetical protein